MPRLTQLWPHEAATPRQARLLPSAPPPARPRFVSLLAPAGGPARVAIPVRLAAYQDSARGFADAGLRADRSTPRLEGVTFLAVSPDGRNVVTVTSPPSYNDFAPRPGAVRLWKPDGAPGTPPMVLAAPATHAAFRPDGKLLATAGSELRFWSLPGGKPTGPVIPVDGSGGAVLVAFSRDGSKVAVVGTPAFSRNRVEAGPCTGARLLGHRRDASHAPP